MSILVRPVFVARCPFCASANTDVERDPRGKYYAVCRSCWAQGSHEKVKAEAVETWSLLGRRNAA